MTCPLGLAALTVLDTPPMRQLDLAERHGFDTIGLRLLPAAPGTTAYPLHEDHTALDMLVRRLEDSPIEVFDLEIIRLDADFDPAAYLGVLEAGARLGAKAVLVGGDDRDRARLIDSYARLAQLCAAYRLRSCRRPMVRRAVCSSTLCTSTARQPRWKTWRRSRASGCTMRRCATVQLLPRPTNPSSSARPAKNG